MVQNVVEAGATLTAFGVDAEDMIKPVADLAAFMGMDVVEASAAMGRAFAGGAGAADILRERGVLQLIKSFNGIDDLSKLTLPEFREAMKKTFTDKQAGIAGATDLLANTFNGQVSIMNDNIAKASAAIGEQLLPVAEDLVELITELAQDTEEFANNLDVDKLQAYAAGLGSVATVVTLYTNRAIIATNATKALQLAMAKTPWGVVAVGAGLLAGKMFELSGVFEDADEDATDLGDSLKYVNSQMALQTSVAAIELSQLESLQEKQIEKLERDKKFKLLSVGMIDTRQSEIDQRQLEIDQKRAELDIDKGIIKTKTEDIETTKKLTDTQQKLYDSTLLTVGANIKLGKSFTDTDRPLRGMGNAAREVGLQHIDASISKTVAEYISRFIATTPMTPWVSGPLAIAGGAMFGSLMSSTVNAIPKFAATGMDEVVDSPTMIIAGEAGAENVQITPLEGPNIDGPQGGGGVTVNISAPLLDDTVIDEIIPRIREAVVRGEDIGIS